MSTDYQHEYSAYLMQKIKSNTSCDITLLKFLGYCTHSLKDCIVLTQINIINCIILG